MEKKIRDEGLIFEQEKEAWNLRIQAVRAKYQEMKELRSHFRSRQISMHEGLFRFDSNPLTKHLVEQLELMEAGELGLSEVVVFQLETVAQMMQGYLVHSGSMEDHFYPIISFTEEDLLNHYHHLDHPSERIEAEQARDLINPRSHTIEQIEQRLAAYRNLHTRFQKYASVLSRLGDSVLFHYWIAHNATVLLNRSINFERTQLEYLQK